MLSPNDFSALRVIQIIVDLLNLLDHVFSSDILLSLLLDGAVDAAEGPRAHHPDVVIQLLVLLTVPGHRHVLRGQGHPGHRGSSSLQTVTGLRIWKREGFHDLITTDKWQTWDNTRECEFLHGVHGLESI